MQLTTLFVDSRRRLMHFVLFHAGDEGCREGMYPDGLHGIYVCLKTKDIADFYCETAVFGAVWKDLKEYVSRYFCIKRGISSRPWL